MLALPGELKTSFLFLGDLLGDSLVGVLALAGGLVGVLPGVDVTGPPDGGLDGVEGGSVDGAAPGVGGARPGVSGVAVVPDLAASWLPGSAPAVSPVG